MKITLGKKYRDKLHDIEGIATCQMRYVTGCDRVTLEVLKDGEIKEFYFDITMLESVKIPKEDARPGGPQPNPPSRNQRK